LDTKTGKHESFLSYEALQGKAQQLGSTLNLERISVVYSRYRYTWFEKLVAFLFCVPPLLFALVLIWWIVRLRKANGM
jgi:hypothetical protein